MATIISQLVNRKLAKAVDRRSSDIDISQAQGGKQDADRACRIDAVA